MTPSTHPLPAGHFDRSVVALMGLPFDVVDMSAAAARVRHAAQTRQRCFISTPNLNFLISAQDDGAFRESVIQSDLSVADGMPLVWLARLLRLPIKDRVSGAGLFEYLCESPPPPIGIFFFGGLPGIAQRAHERVNHLAPPGVHCCGYFDPGLGSVAAMSHPEVLSTINSSQADFLIVALGAQKGQHWIQANRHKLNAPVVCHLGAVINFAAASIARAPQRWQRWGLEWLWRIKEEPALWRRYARDGMRLLQLVSTHVLPHALFLCRYASQAEPSATLDTDLQRGVFRLEGVWVQGTLQHLRDALRLFHQGQAQANEKVPSSQTSTLTIDLQAVTYVDSHFIGLMMLARGVFQSALILRGANPLVKKVFRYHLAGYLLGSA